MSRLDILQFPNRLGKDTSPYLGNDITLFPSCLIFLERGLDAWRQFF
jgi:hypothetical protein